MNAVLLFLCQVCIGPNRKKLRTDMHVHVHTCIFIVSYAVS